MRKIKRAGKRPNTGGILLRGSRTHESKKRPDANLDRKRWNASKGRDDGPSSVSGGRLARLFY